MQGIQRGVVALAIIFLATTARGEVETEDPSICDYLERMPSIHAGFCESTTQFTPAFNPATNCRWLECDDEIADCMVFSDCDDTHNCTTIVVDRLNDACTEDGRLITEIHACPPVGHGILAFAKVLAPDENCTP